MNKAIICGNVGSDPKVGTTSSGKTWAQVSIATNESWKDKNGEKQEKTSWHRLKFWGGLAEVVEKYVRKGSKLLVEGRIEYGEYTDKDGANIKTTEIVVRDMEMLSGKPSGAPEAKEPRDDDVPF